MNKQNNHDVWKAFVMVLQFGINMVVPIVMCVMIGVWIGKKTGADWVTVPLFFVGALAGGRNIYKAVKKIIRDADRKNQQNIAVQTAKLRRSSKTKKKDPGGGKKG